MVKHPLHLYKIFPPISRDTLFRAADDFDNVVVNFRHWLVKEYTAPLDENYVKKSVNDKITASEFLEGMCHVTKRYAARKGAELANKYFNRYFGKLSKVDTYFDKICTSLYSMTIVDEEWCSKFRILIIDNGYEVVKCFDEDLLIAKLGYDITVDQLIDKLDDNEAVVKCGDDKLILRNQEFITAGELVYEKIYQLSVNHFAELQRTLTIRRQGGKYRNTNNVRVIGMTDINDLNMTVGQWITFCPLSLAIKEPCAHHAYTFQFSNELKHIAQHAKYDIYGWLKNHRIIIGLLLTVGLMYFIIF